MLAYLRVLFNPEDDIALLRIINTPPRAIGQTTVDLLVRTAAALQSAYRCSRRLSGIRRRPACAEGALRIPEPARRVDAMRDTCSQRICSGGSLTISVRKMLERQETMEDAESRMSNLEELILAASDHRSGAKPFSSSSTVPPGRGDRCLDPPPE